MEWTEERKRMAYWIAGIIIVLFIVLLMLKFWVTSLVGLAAFGLGFYFGRKSGDSADDHSNKRKREGFL
ncbi:hypothetical protein [Crocinitomix algicola]|uniref:hypothetical protein n=1 Tax=Crocinitomix algicola TaxID=1740263 RepID=UPI000871D751|nr:hypothetical protein [Crocinitomix algicola]